MTHQEFLDRAIQTVRHSSGKGVSSANVENGVGWVTYLVRELDKEGCELIDHHADLNDQYQELKRQEQAEKW